MRRRASAQNGHSQTASPLAYFAKSLHCPVSTMTGSDDPTLVSRNFARSVVFRISQKRILTFAPDRCAILFVCNQLVPFLSRCSCYARSRLAGFSGQWCISLPAPVPLGRLRELLRLAQGAGILTTVLFSAKGDLPLADVSRLSHTQLLLKPIAGDALVSALRDAYSVTPAASADANCEEGSRALG